MNTFILWPRISKVCLFVGIAGALLIGTNLSAKEVRIGLLLDKGGKDDKSFNTGAYQGVMRAKKELKDVQVKYVEANDDNAFESFMRSFAQKHYDLIICVGIGQVEPLKKIAHQYPSQHFAIVDGEVMAPNVRSLLFQEQEGAYLMGAIAALSSKSSVVGFIGGMDIPLIRRFEVGYIAGAKAVSPKVKVISNFIGVTGDAWNNPAKAKELAISQYNSGADVVFAAAGASGAGLFDAAEEKKKFAIGVDANQNGVKPGFVLTSMLKKLDEAVFQVCKDVADGSFVGGTQRLGLANQGIDYAVDSHNEKLLSPSVRKRVDQLKADIISGKVQVPDYYKMKK